MAGYPYLIASLPDLAESLGRQEFDFEATVSFISEHCPAGGRGYIRWMLAFFDPGHKCDTFYRAAARSGSRFIREYTAFDRMVRTAKVAFLDGKKSDGSESADGLWAIFSRSDILEREKELDLLYWRKADELVIRDIFSIDTLLAFIAKAQIADRWNRLDPISGAELFKGLVDEVRGTFDRKTIQTI